MHMKKLCRLIPSRGRQKKLFRRQSNPLNALRRERERRNLLNALRRRKNLRALRRRRSSSRLSLKSLWIIACHALNIWQCNTTCMMLRFGVELRYFRCECRSLERSIVVDSGCGNVRNGYNTIRYFVWHGVYVFGECRSPSVETMKSTWPRW
ncbi:hypothetical protein EDD22DRAFT_1008081 [Suillus occidentalis]|nr:hypothetical protein EDD22DRAFT_1008081 [Suillus occidentalis]